MTHRSLAALALSVAIGLVLMMPAPAASQASGGASEVPRTADGRPDLGGVWDFRTVTPLERPAALGDKAYFTEEEAAEFATRRVRDRNVDLNRATTTTARRVVNGTRESVDLATAYNNFWYDRGNTVVTTGRTSLVIDPPEGRIPTLTAAAQARAAERVTLSQRITEGPEDRSLGERCIVRPNAGPPMTPAGYNNNVQIFQTSDYVASSRNRFTTRGSFRWTSGPISPASCDSGWAMRAAGGKATPWSSKRPISTTGSTSKAPPTRCISSNASAAPMPKRCSTSSP